MKPVASGPARRRRSVVAGLLAVGFTPSVIGLRAYAGTPFVDPLNAPAVPDNRAEHEPLLAVAVAGTRLVVAGLRGLVLWSDDRGQTWTQAAVPVQSDLVALNFVTPSLGWASGHGGVVLHTSDGGKSWIKQFDGLDNAAFVDFYQKRADAGDAAAKSALTLVKLNTAGGPSVPYLDVLFENEHDGFAVGGFGMIMATHDGGAHWEPWLDRIDNPQALYLNAITAIGGDVYIAGEQGKIYRLDRAAQRFVTLDTKYEGSLFGITGTASALLTYGLLGHAFGSGDGGQTWHPVDVGAGSTISSGLTLKDGGTVLIDEGGQVLMSGSAGGAFHQLKLGFSFPFAGIALMGSDQLVLVGVGGVVMTPLPSTVAASAVSPEVR